MLAAALVLAPCAAMPAPPTGPPSSGERVHVIRSGDTLSGIATRYGVSVSSIVRANGLQSERVRLRLGTRLVVPPRNPSVAETGAARRSPGGTDRRHAARTRTRPTAMPASVRLAIPEFLDTMPPFVWPVEGSVSSNFGRRRRGWHTGIDIVAPAGTPVVAAAAGLVVTSAVEHRYGRVVKLVHENGFVSVYAHNSANLVDLGEWVGSGQVIATVGRTGRATAEHLHFEIRHEGYAYNPLYLLPLPTRMGQLDEIESDEDDDHE
jgi:murein DD-endopeptidase MepM/ murein hydrolase activator NlpD